MQFDAIHAIMVEKGFVKKSADLFDADGNLLIEDADDDDMDDDDNYIDDDDEFDIIHIVIISIFNKKIAIGIKK